MTLLPLVLLLPFLAGKLDSLSIMVEFANRSGRFALELRRHLVLGLSSVASGSLIGIPLGYGSTRSPALKGPVFAVAGTLQTFPGLALFGLLVAPLAWLSGRFGLLRVLGIGGIGWAPAYIALTLYSLLPIVQNTFAGFASLSPDMLDAANGMGMTRRQRLFRVEVPVAAPIVLGGVRVATVQAVGNTAVAALIGAGGLGTFIFQGLGEAAPDLILLGALPILLMAVLLDGLLDVLVRLVTPPGIREAAW
jgi:osmoprotectant transport system permease protein